MHSCSRVLLKRSFFVAFMLLTLPSGGPVIDAPGQATNRERRAATHAAHRPGDPDAATTQRVHEQYGRLPISFEYNVGQTDRRVAFLSRGSGYTLFLAAGGEAVLALSATTSATRAALDSRRPGGGADQRRAAPPAVTEHRRSPGKDTGVALRLRLVGADREARAEGREALPGTVNYLKGNDRTQWRAGISTYARVAYDNVYPGIDLVYYGNSRHLEYDFVVRPGASPRTITLEVDGADTLTLDTQGDLVLAVGGREVRQRKPVAYQEVGGVRTTIDSSYTLEGLHRVRFELGAYDARRPVVIDPTLAYSTYLGGSGDNRVGSVAVDTTGSAYVTGSTNASNFPTTTGAFDTSLNGSYDVFVTKLDVAGATLAYSTFLGGTGSEGGSDVAVDATGNAYVTGSTVSSDFPTTAGTFDTSANGGYADAFVTKLDTAGAALVYTTYLGGSSDDRGQSVAVDATGNAYVTGSTDSSNFPTTAGAFDTSWNYGSDAFMTTVNANGATLAYSTFLGGSGVESGRGIAVDPAGNAYVVGDTRSPNFPTTPGAYDATHDSTQEAFVVKFGNEAPSPPGVNITANGSDGPLTLAADDPLAIVLSFNVGSLNVVDPAEVYVGVTTPAGRLWYNPASQTLVPGLRPAYSGPLTSFGPATLVDLPTASSLPTGQYWWFVWVDYDVNGVANGGTFDVVLTTIR